MSRLGQPADPKAPHLGGWVSDGWGGEQVGEIGTYCPAVWDFLIERFGVKRFLDIGCGVGASVKYMHDKGLVSAGVEGDPAAVAAAAIRATMSHEPGVRLHDYITGPCFGPVTVPFDLGYSAEFVEHVDERYLPNYLADMARCKHVLLTHAPPGQEAAGYHHVNCKSTDYWIGVMASAGFRYEDVLTQQIRQIAQEQAGGYGGTKEPCCWFGARTFLFFTKYSELKQADPNDKIVLRAAEYGTANFFRVDEGSYKTSNMNVLEKLAMLLEQSAGRSLQVAVSNETFGGDPAVGVPKRLAVNWSLSSDPDHIYTAVAGEGQTLKLEL